jgi:hypothetical protein
MDSRTEEILKAFPGLRYDGGFRITSPEDADYNCIAMNAHIRDACTEWSFASYVASDNILTQKDNNLLS